MILLIECRRSAEFAPNAPILLVVDLAPGEPLVEDLAGLLAAFSTGPGPGPGPGEPDRHPDAESDDANEYEKSEQHHPKAERHHSDAHLLRAYSTLVAVSGDRDLERALGVLGPLEGRIMRAVWAGLELPFTVRDIQSITPELAYTTLMTTLSRLAEKGVLTQNRVAGQRAYDYQAAGSPSDFLAVTSREQVTKMLEQFGDAALAAFAARLDDLTTDQRERVREVVRCRE